MKFFSSKYFPLVVQTKWIQFRNLESNFVGVLGAWIKN
jgi:hypothetical protein